MGLQNLYQKRFVMKEINYSILQLKRKIEPIGIQIP